MVARSLASHGRAYLDGRVVLRRARRDDAEGGRAIRLPARSFLAALGFSLWLDAVPRYPDRDDCRGCGRFWSLHRRSDSVGVGIELHHRADSFWQLRDFTF